MFYRFIALPKSDNGQSFQSMIHRKTSSEWPRKLAKNADLGIPTPIYWITVSGGGVREIAF